jgi:carbamoyl-phosphate synthase large subunit
VLVTGADGPAGVCVIRALKEAGTPVVAADTDGGTVPCADNPGFVAALCKLATAHGAQVIVSTVAEELPVLAEESAALGAAGLASWLPDPDAARTSLDRWAFAQAVAAAGIPHPPTNVGRANGVPGPWIVKSRFGHWSHDAHAVDDAAELAWAIAHTPGAIVQTRLEGLEFTVDALVDRGGILVGAVPRWRLETEEGVSTAGRTFEDPELVAQVRRLVAALRLEGPVSVQGFMLSSNGLYCFTQVKPAFSAGLSLSLAAGADLVGEYVRGILGRPVRRERLAHRAGVMTEPFSDEVIASRMGSLMASELERLASVAVGHGRNDPAVDVFLLFVGALDPLPDAGTLRPAAQRIGMLRLAEALDVPGETRLGACRLLAAASGGPLRPVAPPPALPVHQPVGRTPERSEDVVGHSGGSLPRAVTVERPAETGRRLPEMVEALSHAVRTALSLFAWR